MQLVSLPMSDGDLLALSYLRYRAKMSY